MGEGSAVAQSRRDAGVARIIGTKSFDRSRAIQWTIYAGTVLLVVLPIAPILYQSFIDRPIYDAGAQLTLANYRGLFASGDLTKVAFNTLAFALMQTVFAQIFGALFAVLVGRTDMPGQKVFANILMWPLFLSAIVLGTGWYLAYGPSGYITQYIRSLVGVQPWSLGSLVGISIISGVSSAPLAMLYCLGSAALSDSALEDAARACGAGPLRILMRITLPLLMPAVVYGAVLNFTIALETLSLPLMFGEPAGITFFTTYLYTQGITAPQPNYGLVGTAAVMLLAIISLLIYLQTKILRDARRFITVGGKGSRRKPLQLGWLKWPAFGIVTIYVVLFIVGPVALVGLRAVVKFLTPFIPFWNLLTLDNFAKVFETDVARRSIVNTLFIAAIGGALATLVIASITVVVSRSEFPLRRSLGYIALYARALPGLVAGLGYFYAMVLFPPIGWLQGTVWILIVVYTMRYIPTGYGAIAPVLFQIGPELDRSARVMGADWWTTTRRIIFSLLKPGLLTCFALIFVSFLKEYSIAVFLVRPGSEVIGSTLLFWWLAGDLGLVSALSVVQIIFIGVFIYVVQRVVGVKLYG